MFAVPLARYAFGFAAQTFSVGLLELPVEALPFARWLCPGSSATLSACASSPPVSPCGWSALAETTTRPRRSGSANVTRPSPP